MYNISIVENTGLTTWHSDVLAYDIYDKNQSNTLIGRAYLDLYPRASKFKHAAMFPIRRGMLDMQIPEAALVCNFPKAPAQMYGLHLMCPSPLYLCRREQVSYAS